MDKFEKAENEMLDCVRFSAYFNRNATEAELEEFWKEYVDQGYVILDEIGEAEIIDTDTDETVDSVWVCKLRTNMENYSWFEKEFGPYLLIKQDD